MDPLTLTGVLTAAALFTSTVSGVVGMAGGAMLLGTMVALGLDPILTVPIHAAIQLVSNTTRTVAHLSHVRWGPWAIATAAALPGPLLGLWLVQELDPDGVRLLMAGLILYAVWAPKWGLQSLGDRAAFALAGGLGGVLGVVIGAVGPLLAPFFLRRGFEKRTIIGTKAACQGSQHVIKLLAFSGLYPAALAAEPGMFRLWEHLDLILPLGAATIAGTYLGRWILGYVSESKFVLLYKGVLTLLAVRLVTQSVW